MSEEEKNTTEEISTNTRQSPTTIEETKDNADKPKKTGYEEIDSLTHGKSDIIDEDMFSLPDDRDFYINAVDSDWYVKIAGIADTDQKTAMTKTQAAVYYTEDPPILEPGYYKDKSVYIVRPTNLKRGSQDVDVFMGFQDGDTISFSASECECGDSETQTFIDNTGHRFAVEILGYNPADPNSIEDVWKKEKLDTMEVRIFGIDCPEVPHVAVIPDSAMDKVSSCNLGDLVNDSDAAYIKYRCADNLGTDPRTWRFEARDPDTDTMYVEIGGKKHEVLPKRTYAEYRGDMTKIDWGEASNYVYVSSDSTAIDKLAQGNVAARLMHDLIQKAQDARIMVNAGNMSTRGNSSYTPNPPQGFGTSSFWNDLRDLAKPFLGHSLFNHTGFNQAGQELYGRVLGALYLYGPYGEDDKVIWINAAKYIASQTSETQLNKSINGSVTNGALKNMAPDIFNAESYEYNWELYADAMWENLERFDDREKVQFDVLKQHRGRMVSLKDIQKISSLTDWTCVIGDVALMVPPTSIRCITQTTTERIPLVRAKGTIAKGGEHSDRLIELHLYFNEEGINGIPWTTDLPSAKSKQVKNPEDAKITYSMNGLRALISEFRLVPYIPIDNAYINDVLNVTAVCFQSISVSTVPKFPKLVQCVLTLREFSPSAFMPQIPEKFGEIDTQNYFAKMINYETMRYYYQRPIVLGNEIAKTAAKNNTPIDITSKEFAEKTLFANRTAMIPCNFASHEMDFYTASESYLNTLLNIKRNMANKSAGGSFQPRTEPQQKFMDRMAKVMKGFYEAISDSAFNEYLANMSKQAPPPKNMIETSLRTMENRLRAEAGDIITSVTYSTDTATTNPYMTIKLDMPSIQSDEQLRTLREMAGAKYNADLSGAIMTATLVIELTKDNNGTWYFNRYTPDIYFATYCYDEANTPDANSEAMKKKQSMDIEDADSIRFEPYLKHVRLDSISVQFANQMTTVSLQNSDSIAPQYMGGTDCDLVVSITTSSERIAALLDRLPKYSSYLHRTYHTVLPMYPVKVDSEFTRMLGISEVTFDNVVVNTVPNFPGVYSIQLTLKSVDRTLRNREALKRVNVTEHSNEHVTKNTNVSKDRMNTYFDLSETMSQINLYPDLELPSIKELAERGFQFIRYKNRTMKYPDPDFYFIYPGAIFNEIIRENVFGYLQTLKKKLGNTAYKDKYGAQIEMSFGGKLNMETANQTLRAQVNVIKEQDKIELEDARRRAEVMDEALAGAMVADPGSWDISPTIKTVFMETYYFRELMLYLNQIKLGIFKHNTKADTLEQKKAYEKDKAAGNAADSADDKLSYQATKGLHLYDRLEVIRDRIKQIDAILTESVDKPNRDFGNSLESYASTMPLRFVSGFDKVPVQKKGPTPTIYTSPTDDGDILVAESEISNLLAAALAARAGRREFNFKESSISSDNATGAAVGAGIGAAVGAGATVLTGGFAVPLIGAGAAAGAAIGSMYRKRYSFTDCLENTQEIWLPDSNIVGITTGSVSQDPGGRQYVTKERYEQAKAIGGETFDKFLDSITEAGICRIKFYTKAGITNLIAPEPIDVDSLEYKDSEMYTGSDAVFPLDPYYRYEPVSSIRKFKQRLIEDKKFCGIIFCREFLYWLQQLYKTYTLPSISLDIHREEAKSEAKILEQLQTQIDEYNGKPFEEAYGGYSDPKSKQENKEKAEKEAEEKQNHKKEQLKAGQTTTTKESGNVKTPSDTKGSKADQIELTEFQKTMAKTISEFLQKSSKALDLGKIFAALCLTVTGGDKGLFQDMKSRNYKALNAYVKEAARVAPGDQTETDVKYAMRKFILACIGTGAINAPEDLGEAPELPSQRYVSDFNQRKVLEAANKPEQWVIHSFLDMAQSDFRGRMLRAFPTFYMILVDEGREIGFWKLHDNFYNTNAISDIKITKSRKNPSDTCMITMSNIFDTFTNQDEDGKYNFDYNYRDVFKSIFSPREYAEDEEIRRKSIQEINKAKIRTGARMHLRLGYGNDASIMPLAFNGTIAQVQEGPVVQIMAQGDGIELCNHILDVGENDDVDDIMYRSNFMGNTFWEATGGQTPKTILNNMFQTRGSWLAKKVEDMSISKYFDENPYGIYHFGDRNYKDIIEDGEPTQNIYEVDRNPSWGYVANDVEDEETDETKSKQTAEDGTEVEDVKTEHKAKSDLYNPIDAHDRVFGSDNSKAEGPPTLSFKVANKTIWDIAHICASINSQFITDIAPFGFRSTLFFGRPHYYYAYDYKIVNGTVVEKRKPYQQYHIYFSTTDIVNNQITTSTTKVKTVVTGLFKRKTPFSENCKVGPLHADYSIYPENQRSILFDTQYIGKFQDFNRGYPGRYGKDRAGTDGTFSQVGQYVVNAGKNLVDNIGYVIGDFVPEENLRDKHHNAAWNMSATKLKECMHELYQGQLLVLGDPSVKPYDRIMFNDLYRDMNGQFLVRDVTHMFSAQSGFTTAITPDCIVTVDDRDEYVVQSAGDVIMARSVQTFMTYMIGKGVGKYFAKRGMESVKNAEKWLSKSMNKLKESNLGKKASDLTKEAKEREGGTTKKTANRIKKFFNVKKLKNTKDAIKLLLKGGVAAVGAIGAGVAAGPAIITTLLGIGASYVISAALGGALYNSIRNLRVVKVFPIKRYGRPYIAGLDGSHGLIYGSPTWDQEDFIGSTIGYLFAPGKGDSTGSYIANIMRELVLDDDIMNAAAKFEHEADITDAEGNPTQNEEHFALLESQLMKSNMCFEGASQKLKYSPRATINDKAQIEKNTEAFRCKSVNTLTTDPALQGLRLIRVFPSIEPFVKNQFLRIVHDGQTFSDLSRVHDYNLKISGQVVQVHGIEDDKGNIDLPLLHDDACVVLADILYKSYRLVTNGSVSNANDNAQTKHDTNKQFVTLKKAYTVGDSNLFTSSGFAFVIEPHGAPIVSQFKKIIDDIMEAANGKSESDKKIPVVQYQYNGGEYAIVVTPPNK